MTDIVHESSRAQVIEVRLDMDSPTGPVDKWASNYSFIRESAINPCSHCAAGLITDSKVAVRHVFHPLRLRIGH